jgi:hypothetical protein
MKWKEWNSNVVVIEEDERKLVVVNEVLLAIGRRIGGGAEPRAGKQAANSGSIRIR